MGDVAQREQQPEAWRVRTSTGKATKAQIARWQRFESLGCIACWQHGVYSVPEVQHLLSGGRRKGHDFTIPLCPYHHRGVGQGIGTSLAFGSKPFHEQYGSDDRLLMLTNDLLSRRQVLCG